jgi:hypothetical protein
MTKGDVGSLVCPAAMTAVLPRRSGVRTSDFKKVEADFIFPIISCERISSLPV